MLENTLELPNNKLACSSSSLELSPKENLSSSSSTSSRSGSFCLYNYKSKIKKLKKQSLRRAYLKQKLKRAGSKFGYSKEKRYASLSSASSTSSSVSSSPTNLIEQTQEKEEPRKKPMKLHKFYHSVPFKCPFCFTFKEIPQDFIDHLTSIHFSDVKLLYERKCTTILEPSDNAENTNPTDLSEIPSKLRKMMKDFEEENNEENDENKQEMIINDEENDECLNNESKNLEKEQEIHTPPKTPPTETKQENLISPKSSYLSMNTSALPPRKQQRLLKSPFEVEREENFDQNTQKIIQAKNLPFSVPSLLSDQPTHNNYMNNLNQNVTSMNQQQNNHQTQEASMKCAICDRGFEYYSNLRRHIKTKHKIYGKQVKEYVIRQQNTKKNDNESAYKSPVNFNPVKKQKNENDESFDEDIDESQAELASSTSTTSSSFSSNSSPLMYTQQNQNNSSSSSSSNQALMNAAAALSAFPATPMINQQQMLAFLNHTNTMSKLKSSLLESLLNRKMPDHQTSQDEPKLEDPKINNFSKLIQNIVEMNQQISNASVLAAMNQIPNVKSEAIEEADNNSENLQSEQNEEMQKPRQNRRYHSQISKSNDEESDVDLYDEDTTQNKKEDNYEYEENDHDQDAKNNDVDEMDNENDDMQSRTSSSRSYHSDLQSNHMTPSVTPNKFMFNHPLSTQLPPPPINQFVLENHLRNLTQHNFSHHAYQAYQQNLQRFNLANQQFLNSNPVNLLNQQQINQQPNVPQVPTGIRRKKSKDLSTSSMVQSMRNLQCSPTSQPTNNSEQGGNIRFSSEIWRCPYCCYETTSASRYNSHLVCHGWKPYLCPHCGSRSNRLPDMRTHISTFHPEFNVNTFVVLSEEEAKSTLKDYMKNRALINRKLKEMRPQPKFKCKLCPYASLYQFNLTKHVKSVHLSDVYHNNSNAAKMAAANQNKDP
ncbi:unnamed protein product [Brachionus calyciflorus]|uniref:C2H2-type domain-containing protein n=1 Tax=Brachionus calyciflorus TaxID=104777 RepID=A0A813MSF2_9BILA|nr:unnamed protein product [Brachionus calyciflorus]